MDFFCAAGLLVYDMHSFQRLFQTLGRRLVVNWPVKKLLVQCPTKLVLHTRFTYEIAGCRSSHWILLLMMNNSQQHYEEIYRQKPLLTACL